MSTDEDLIHGRIVSYKHAGQTHRLHLHRIAHAREDLEEDVREEAIRIASTPANVDFRHKIVDVLENAAEDAYGNLERVPLLHFLSQYPVTPYTYEISDDLSRGERPSPDKLEDLVNNKGYRATINLCAEMVDGDAPIIARAHLTEPLQTYHIPITDMEAPEPKQVIQILRFLAEPGHRPAYLHCEAGKARTGVITACYRTAVMGWSPENALTEAKHFGCSVPAQQAFIQQFGAMLQAQYNARANDKPVPHPELGDYPAKRLDSAPVTSEELAATLASVARSEEGMIE